ncbi:thioredoxin family protein [uncultured Microbulbifer sp.]|uniref:thioredoxin family protein n=1 Tax=uncultured Microbulbifer sp. TaxID=348147 RepID=UPI00262E35B0|nr:thioredoxin family protein [uncultured Microbulbifer sp.]
MAIIFKNKKKQIESLGYPINIKSKYELESVLKTHNFALLDFWTRWCGSCLLMNDALNKISKEYSENLTVVKIDASFDSEIMNQYNIKGLPTIMLIKNNEICVQKYAALTLKELRDLVKINI